MVGGTTQRQRPLCSPNNLASAMAIPDSPKAALQRLLLLYEAVITGRSPAS
ncbi:Hypothetical protein FKW44_009705 [Caligus rogercresseyi]|uniref:Uncharacterized protein n=1 Tax=Caligus rogercresseyi TaxID=217165 RepID=A0A7T8HFZ7_CALRO|nr:Hypothetical protein FKW44_009705 [Caligus rogercresseyi]